MTECAGFSKNGKPPQKRLNGIMNQSSEWKMLLGLDMAAQWMVSPESSSGWIFSAARGSIEIIFLLGKKTESK